MHTESATNFWLVRSLRHGRYLYCYDPKIVSWVKMILLGSCQSCFNLVWRTALQIAEGLYRTVRGWSIFIHSTQATT